MADETVHPQKKNNKLVSLLIYLYVLVRLTLSTLWIHINRFLFQSTNENCHNIVVIGDSFAFGLGDSIVASEIAGISHSISSAIPLDRTIRRGWRVLNCGSPKSTTRDWLPGGKLFKKTFQKIPKAEIVIVFMGTRDIIEAIEGLPESALKRDMVEPYAEEEISTLASNIRLISTALQSQGKRVLVVDMPTTGVPQTGRGKMRRLNAQIKQVIKKQNSTCNSSLHKIHLISLGNNHRIMRIENRACDSLHLNRKGYKILSADIFQNGLKDMIVNVEWDVWKGLLKEQPGGLNQYKKAMREGESAKKES